MASSPVVPQRPARSQNSSVHSLDTTAPQVPPRPNRQGDRSISRDRDGYVRSPLNESPFANKVPSRDPSASRPARPPSVNSLPLIGQEGMEYASLEYSNKSLVDGAASPNQTRNVARDLPLHAPKASVPSQSATSKIASAGDASPAESPRTGATKYSSLEDPEHSRRPPSARAQGHHRPQSASFDRTTSSRAESINEHDDHGIPEIGVQVPLLSMAGDVQAPSPAPSQILAARRRSAHDLVPPGSYGLHGHGSGPMDKFDMDWYQKHPEELAKEEHGAYGPSMTSVRSEYVMSSDDLNKMVRDSGSRGNIVSTPSLPPEDYGYSAGPDEVRSRSQTPLHKVKSRSSSTHVDSPLRRSFHPDDRQESALESETEDENRLRPLSRPQSKSDWFHSQDDLHRQLHHHNVSEDLNDGYTTPILAEDEVAKNPMGYSLHPAVTSEDARSREFFQSHLDYEAAHNHPRSRSASRPSSVHSHSGLSRFISHDHEASHPHLAEIEEYEPLFKDEQDGGKLRKLKTAEKVKRLEQLGRFPSRDIWEDTPDSLRLETEVATPDLEPDVSQSYFESPADEKARRPGLADTRESSFLDDESKTKMDRRQAAALAARHPSHRFPSRDVWEDTPDSSYLVTTVKPEEEEQAGASMRGRQGDQAQASKAQPTVPPRPSRVKAVEPSEIPATVDQKVAPSVPDRPKPQVPARPRRSSAEEASAPPVAKTKPTIPSSSSSKFSAIKAGFMNDLNSRLKIGPKTAQKPKAEEEQEQEKVPLADARKGRAKGPQRRTPPTNTPAAPQPARQIATGWSISKPWTVWSISEEKELEIGVDPEKAAEPAAHDEPAQHQAANTEDLNEIPSVSPLATNTAGERLERPGVATRVSAGALAHPSNADMDARARSEELAAKESLKQHTVSTIGAEGDIPEPIVDQPKPVSGTRAPPSLPKEESSTHSDDVKAAAGVPESLSKTTSAPMQTGQDDDTSPAAVTVSTNLAEGEGAELSRQYSPPALGGSPLEEKSEANGGLARE